MVKLEVGSKVRHRTCDPHEIGLVTEFRGGDYYRIKWPEDSACGYSTDHIDNLVPVYSSCEAAQVDVQSEEYGPIRTRSAREIVPGVYGVIRIERGANGYVIDMWKANPNADELREAAHLFNQLAEVLDDNRS